VEAACRCGGLRLRIEHARRDVGAGELAGCAAEPGDAVGVGGGVLGSLRDSASHGGQLLLFMVFVAAAAAVAGTHVVAVAYGDGDREGDGGREGTGDRAERGGGAGDGGAGCLGLGNLRRPRNPEPSVIVRVARAKPAIQAPQDEGEARLERPSATHEGVAANAVRNPPRVDDTRPDPLLHARRQLSCARLVVARKPLLLQHFQLLRACGGGVPVCLLSSLRPSARESARPLTRPSPARTPASPAAFVHFRLRLARLPRHQG